MKIKPSLLLAFLLSLSLVQLGMGSRGQYDEEAREQERIAKLEEKAHKERKNPVTQFADGVKQTTVDSTRGFVSETTDGTLSDSPIVGTLEGARRGSEKILDNTVKGAVKVATLGYGEVDSYEVEEPEAGTDEPTKIRIKIPGT